MADPNTRQGKRTPVTLKIKFKSETLEQFIERYAVDVSQGGIFIRTKEPLAVGTQMKFEFQLRDASPLIAGEGTVVWTRENDPSRPAIAPGMGVRFDRLNDGSQTVLEKILAEKGKQAPARNKAESTKPPMFTDTPTRVAPIPVQEALGARGKTDTFGGSSGTGDKTPLPKPMPFHSDADEFDQEAFEEATKVRALDELVAQTAGIDAKTASALMPPDELAARRTTPGRADSTLADPPAAPERFATVPDRDSAPGLPSPPEPAPRATSPSEPPMRSASPSVPPLNAASTRLGLEPAKATGPMKQVPAAPIAAPVEPSRPIKDTSRVAPRQVAVEETRPTRRPSVAPVIIGMLVVVAGALAAVWYFVLRDTVTASTTSAAKPTSGSNTPTLGSNAPTAGSNAATLGSNAGVASGSNAGSAVAMAGSNAGSNAVAQVEPPKGPVVDTVFTSSVKGAKIEILGTGQEGPAPLTAKLEKGRAYKARVQAPGFIVLETEVKGGEKVAPFKLVAKPRVVSVSSEPAGAQILIDGSPTGHVTPFDVELTATQAARSKVHVQVRKAGFRLSDQVVDAAAWTEDDAKLTAQVDAKLVAAAVVRVNNGGGTTHTNPNTGNGSATESNGGTGSATPESGSSGTGTTGTGTTGTGTTGTGTTGTGTTGTGTTGTTGTGTTGTGTTGTGTTGTGTTGTGTTGTGAGSASTPKPPTGTGTTGTGAGSASAPKPPPTSSGSALAPEPDWSK